MSELISGAQFSPDRVYRYVLWRIWDVAKDQIAFIGLNPSTADEIQDDPTIRRCIRFAHDWDFGAVIILNIFAYRSTDPRKLYNIALEPIGAENDRYIVEYGTNPKTRMVVAAWGTHGKLGNRGNQVRCLIPYYLYHLGLTKDGYPKHPLYLPTNAKPILWECGGIHNEKNG